MGWKEWWGWYDRERWARENPNYEDFRSRATDNEYLFYINHKLRYANTVLDRIFTLLCWIAGFAGLSTAKYLGLLSWNA
jgi:hypothetical protein